MKHTWGITPGTVTYNALLEICAATNDYERGCQARCALGRRVRSQTQAQTRAL
jgi:hypothetical protein